MSVLQDVRYAFRQLLRSPGVTLAAVLTLGLGIGATTGVFSVANAILLRPPGGVGEFGELVSIYTSDFSGPQYGGSSVPDIQDFAEGAPALSGVVGYSVIPIVLGTESGVRVPELILGQAVTDGFFEVLQTPFEVGRAFTAEEARLRSNVVVLGYDFWRRGLDGDTGVVGSVIRLGGSQFTVVGVAAEDFKGLLPGIVPAFYAPGVASGMSRFVEVDRRGARSMFTVGRLTGGATVEQARAQLEVVAGSLHGEFPDAWTDVRGEARRVTVLRSSDAIVPPQLRGPVIGFVGMLMAIAVGVLIIGCTNIANLLLARAAARRHEFGVRLALGAGRTRLVRQLLTESVVLAGLGAMLGLAVAWGGTGAVAAIELPLPFDVRLDVAPDLRVLGFAALVTGGAALVFGLAPAFLATRQNLRPMLRQEASGRRRLGLRNVLAAGQVCVVVVLLVAGGLLVRSLQSALSVDPGFEPDGLLFVSLAVDLADRSEEERVLLQRQIVERARALPGVAGASYTSSLPLGAGQGRRSFGVEGYQPGASEDMEIHFSFAGPGYFGVMGTPFVRGRDFDGTDGPGAPHAAIVNGAFAARYLPGGDPVGRRLSSGGTSPLSIEIVGVVEDGKYVTLGEEPRPFVWLAADQWSSELLTITVRATSSVEGLAQSLQGIVADVDPEIAVTDVALADQHLALALLPQRAGAWLLGLFGLLGLALAALGVYGVTAYGVTQRTREFGIRLALGSQARDLVRMVVRQGVATAALGAGLGLILSAGVARLIQFVLFDVGPFDLVTFAGVTAIVGAVVFVANWLPARHTAGLDPVSALRYE